MTDYSKITALYSRLSVGDEDRDGGESNSIQNQKIFLENYARGQHLTNAYCGEPAPGQDGKTCREIGATSSFRSKVRNNDVWKAHQRAYKNILPVPERGR